MYFVISKENDYLGKVYFTGNDTDVNGMRLNRFSNDIKQACKYSTILEAEIYAKYYDITDYEIGEVE